MNSKTTSLGFKVCRGIHRVVPSSITSNSSQANIFGNQKSLSSRFSKSKSQSATKSKLNSKPSSSRLFILKAAAEMATDRLKFKKSRQNLKASDLVGKPAKVDSPKQDAKNLTKAGKNAKKTKVQKATADKEQPSANKKSTSKKSKLSKVPASASKGGASKSNESASHLVDADDDDNDFQAEVNNGS